MNISFLCTARLTISFHDVVFSATNTQHYWDSQHIPRPLIGYFVSITSNVTTVTEVQSASARFFAGTWLPLVSVITTLYYYVAVMFHRRVWTRMKLDNILGTLLYLKKTKLNERRVLYLLHDICFCLSTPESRVVQILTLTRGSVHLVHLTSVIRMPPALWSHLTCVPVTRPAVTGVNAIKDTPVMD